MKVDTTTLADIINQCFDFSMDGRFTEDQQTSFLAEGKRLRGLLLNLISAQFDDGTQAVLDANTQITNLNTKLANDATVLANTAATVNNIAGLVASLDKLLNVAASFL